MDKVVIYGAVAALIVVALVAALALGGSGSKAAGTTSSVSSTVTQQTNDSGALFSSQPYFSYAYLIAPGSVSPQSRSALDGYNMTVSQQADGSENVQLSVVGTGRSDAITLTAGQKLYIVETSFGDDGPNYDGSLADDGFVLVGTTGYVVNTFSV